MNKLVKILCMLGGVSLLGGCFSTTPERPDHPGQSNLASLKVHADVLGIGGTVGGNIHTSPGGGYGRQGVNLGGGYIQQRQMYGGGMMPSFGGLPVGECNPAGVGIIDSFTAVAVPEAERTRKSKDTGGNMVGGIVRCHYVTSAGSSFGVPSRPQMQMQPQPQMQPQMPQYYGHQMQMQPQPQMQQQYYNNQYWGGQ